MTRTPQRLVAAIPGVLLALLAAFLLPACPEPNNLGPCEALLVTQKRAGTRIEGAAPSALSLAFYRITGDGIVVPPSQDPCPLAITARLQEACIFCNDAPTRCEALARAIFQELPGECGICGDRVCLSSETRDSCPEDCAAVCGDDVCQASDGETTTTCPIDCAEPCGNGICSVGETPDSCPQDCNFTIGNDVCEPGESPEIAPEDCQQTCGDGICQSYETALVTREGQVRCTADCCTPNLCNDQIGTSICVDGRTAARCDIGPDGCPAPIEPRECPFGCDYRSGPKQAACTPCTAVAEALGREPCSQGDATTCDTDGNRVVCAPIRGFPGCFAKERIPCARTPVLSADFEARNICRPEGCVGCPPDGCPLGDTRCVDQNTVETCATQPGSSCVAYVASEICTGTDRCDVSPDGRVQCCPQDPCSIGAFRCGLDRVERCVPASANATCGRWETVEECTGDEACTVGEGIGNLKCCSVSDPCTPGARRCSNRNTIEYCEGVPTAPCGDWIVQQACDPGTACDQNTVELFAFECCPDLPPEQRCSVAGATRCDGDRAAQRCTAGPGNCLSWQDISVCEAGICDIGPSGPFCSPCCDPGEQRCSGDKTGVQLCQDRGDGCGTWSHTSSCTDRGYCDAQTLTCLRCFTDGDIDAFRRCDPSNHNNAQYARSEVRPGCFGFTSTEPCGAGNTCVAGECLSCCTPGDRRCQASSPGIDLQKVQECLPNPGAANAPAECAGVFHPYSDQRGTIDTCRLPLRCDIPAATAGGQPLACACSYESPVTGGDDSACRYCAFNGTGFQLETDLTCAANQRCTYNGGRETATCVPR